MAVGMARAGAFIAARSMLAFVFAIFLPVGGVMPVLAQGTPGIAPVPKACAVPNGAIATDNALPNVAKALKERKKIVILAMGTGSVISRGAGGTPFDVVEKLIEETFRGVDVEIVNRGVSGELAADAFERIKMEVALSGADLVLWQLGMADAMARLPVDEFKSTLDGAITWLQEHKVDVILVGLRYAKGLARDPHYQSVRKAIGDVGAHRKVMRIGRYAAEETLAKIRQNEGVELSDVEATDASYACMAEYLARAIAAGLFVRQSPAGGAPPKKAP